MYLGTRVGVPLRRVGDAGGHGGVLEVRQHVRVHEQVVVVRHHLVWDVVVERRRAHGDAGHRV